MDLIKWTPFHDVDRFFDEDFFPLVPAVSKTVKPSMDIYQTKDDIIAEVQLAGVDPKDVKITIENDILTVRGEMKKEKETKEKNYYCQEIRSGSFTRSISLPVHVKGDKARAESKDGLLKITMPKAEKKASRQIPIAVKK
jgi:HSP20 family protein